MKNLFLRSYYSLRLGIIQVRLYFVINDYNFVQDDWDKTQLMKKITRLSARQFYFLHKIESL